MTRILIVDDDQTQRNSLMELIAEKNVILSAAASGAEALDNLKGNDYDCMVLDLGLTDMTGFELLERMSTSGYGNRMKIFVYTGREHSRSEELTLSRHADTIII